MYKIIKFLLNHLTFPISQNLEQSLNLEPKWLHQIDSHKEVNQEGLAMPVKYLLQFLRVDRKVGV